LFLDIKLGQYKKWTSRPITRDISLCNKHLEFILLTELHLPK